MWGTGFNIKVWARAGRTVAAGAAGFPAPPTNPPPCPHRHRTTPQINVTWVGELLPYLNDVDPKAFGQLIADLAPALGKVGAAPAARFVVAPRRARGLICCQLSTHA